MKKSIALIGPGRVGCAITKRLYQAGHPITAIVGRNYNKTVAACEFISCPISHATTELNGLSKVDIVLLAVPDDRISTLAAKLQKLNNFSETTTLAHFSGLHSATVMHQQNSPVQLLSIHPLLPFADRQSAFLNLNNCPCALEGDASALSLGEQLIHSIGGQCFLIKGEKKDLYHTSACIASNFLVTLIAWARDLLSHCGIENTHAVPLLMPLIQATLDNIKAYGPEQGLTGPIVRGDCGTVIRHLEELKKTSSNQLDTYLELGKLTLSLAEKSGRLDKSFISNLQTILEKAQHIQITKNKSELK